MLGDVSAQSVLRKGADTRAILGRKLTCLVTCTQMLVGGNNPRLRTARAGRRWYGDTLLVIQNTESLIAVSPMYTLSPHIKSDLFSAIIRSFSLLLARVVLAAWHIRILAKILINFNLIGRVMYPNKVVQYRQFPNQLGLSPNGVLLGQQKDLETPLNNSKDPLDHIPELCMTEVE